MRLFWLLLFMNIGLADYGGGYAGSGFRYVSNAREFSLAGALIADKTPGFYAFSNPALLQFARNNHIGISFQTMSLDRSIHSFSYARRLPPNAGVGLAILRSGTDNIMGRDGMNNETESFSSSEIEGIISFGVGFGSKFALGINIKALFTSIYKVKSSWSFFPKYVSRPIHKELQFCQTTSAKRWCRSSPTPIWNR